MEASVINWLYSVLASAAGAAFLIGLAGYLGRAQLSHWLNKDLEAVKATHQRELEAYKVSLIAQAEGAKARQDVRKAMAMRIAEKKFDAIDLLHRTMVESGISGVIASFNVLENAEFSVRQKQMSVLTDKIFKVSKAIDMATHFLSSEQRSKFRNYAATMAQLISNLGQENTSMESAKLKSETDRLTQLEIECSNIVEAILSEMFDVEKIKI